MRNFFSKIADFLYAAKDYLIILIIFVVLIGILAWRLDMMFTHKLTPEEEVTSGVVEPSGDTNIEEAEDQIEETEESGEPQIETPVEETEPAEPFDEEEWETEEETLPPTAFTVPEDFTVEGLDQSLAELDLIEAGTFIQRIESLQLQGSILPGYYEIPRNYTVDDIVIMITY